MEPRSGKKKRNRVPLACSSCRMKKKKCDRLRPKCSYCLKNKGECVYESKLKSIFNDNPLFQHYTLDTPDSREESDILLQQIESLKQELASLRNRQSSESPVRYEDLQPRSEAGSDTVSIDQDDDYYDFFTNKSFIATRSNSLTNLKPLHHIMIVKCDPNICSITGHLNLWYKFGKQYIKNMAIKTDEDILVTPLPAQLNESFKIQKLTFLSNFAMNTESTYYRQTLRRIKDIYYTRKNTRIDSSVLGYSTSTERVRVKLSQEIANVLPKKVSEMRLLWRTFEKFIYPFVPVFDMNAYKNDIELIIIGLNLNYSPDVIDEADSLVTYSVNFVSFLDLSLVASFLVILRMSYVVLKINIDNLPFPTKTEKIMCDLNNLSYIGSDYINLASVCLAQANALVKTGIPSLYSFILLNYYFSFSEEVACNFDENNKTNILYSLDGIVSSLGMYRDWSVVGFDPNKTHTGADFSDRPTLLYAVRKAMFYVVSANVQEFVISGARMTRTCKSFEKFIKFPQAPTLTKKSLNCFSIDEENILNSLIDNDALEQNELNLQLFKFESMIYDNTQTKLSEFIGLYKSYNQFFYTKFKDPVEYFNDDKNFGEYHNFNLSRDKDERQSDYFFVLNKVFHFERFLSLFCCFVKMNTLLYLHYENSKNIDRTYHFIKDEIINVSTYVRIILRDYVLNNTKFLRIEKDGVLKDSNVEFKSFNNRLIPKIARISYTVFYMFTGIIFRSFVYLHRLRSEIDEFEDPDSVKIKLDNAKKMESMIKFKDTAMKVAEIMIRGFYGKSAQFYYHQSKMHLATQFILSELQRFDSIMIRCNYQPDTANFFNYEFSKSESETKNQYVHLKLGVSFQLKDLPSNSDFFDLEPHQIDELTAILTFDESKTRGFKTGSYIDDLVTIIHTNDLYQTFKTDISYESLTPANFEKLFSKFPEC